MVSTETHLSFGSVIIYNLINFGNKYIMADVGYFDSVSANLKTGIRSAGQGGGRRG